MIDDDAHTDKYEHYAEQFENSRPGRKAGRKPKPRSAMDTAQPRAVADLVEPTGLEGGFTMSYQPARYEEGWLRTSLHMFYEEHLITDVLGQVKGGKEASVYRCVAHPTTGATMLAAKVYRPRMFRNLRNDQMYREGRTILTADGSPVKKTDHRIMRALGKKTAFGVQVQHTSWLMHEYTTMGRLYQAGAAVPRPVAVGENAILMSYYGDERRAAPALNEIRLAGDEATQLFREVLRNIELMLQHGLIHGDLSAYNLLYWQGQIVIIDFPQVTDLATNVNADFILQRDITRVCEYFSRQGVACDTSAIMEQLWERYATVEIDEHAAIDGAVPLLET